MAAILRQTRLLCLLAAGQFAIMTAIEFLWFRSLGGDLSLDLRLRGFDYDEAISWLCKLGPEGAQTIIVWHYRTFDLIFPALLSLALASLIIKYCDALPRFAGWSADRKAFLALAVVAPYCLFDYAQNIAVAQILADTINVKPATISLASELVVAKFVCLAVPFAVILFFVLAGKRWRAPTTDMDGENR